MKRGEGFYKNLENQLIYFLPELNQLHTEPFPELIVDLPPQIFPEVKELYMITNHGRIWHKYLAQFLNDNIDSKGYKYKPLALKDGGQRNYRVHRLVMMTFAYIPGCEQMIVNHLDLDKTNDLITNLEWTTYSGNVVHAYENGAIDKEKMYRYKYGGDELIHAICFDLQEGILTNEQIGAKYNVPTDSVDAIKYKKAHTNISDNYNFNTGSIYNKYKAGAKVDLELVQKICQYYQDTVYPENVFQKHEYYEKVLDIFGMDHSEKNMRFLKRLRNRSSFTEISKDYIW